MLTLTSQMSLSWLCNIYLSKELERDVRVHEKVFFYNKNNMNASISIPKPGMRVLIARLQKCRISFQEYYGTESNI